jgi:hypothetical protein
LGREQVEKNQFDKEKRGWDGKQEKQFLLDISSSAYKE